MNNIIVMLLRGDLFFDTRVKKEASTLSENGFEVIVLTTQASSSICGKYTYYLVEDNDLIISKIRNSHLKRSENLKKGKLAIEHCLMKTFYIINMSVSYFIDHLIGQIVFKNFRDILKLIIRKINSVFYRMLYLIIVVLYNALYYVCKRYYVFQRLFWKHFIRYFSYFFSYYYNVADLLEKIRPDFVHAHDLNTLVAGLRYSKKSGCLLIYDSHELEIHRNSSKKFLIPRVYFERKCIKHADLVITVSNSISNYLANIYHIEPPVVVYNSPSIKTLISTYNTERNLKDELGLSKSQLLVLYIGGNLIGRGLDKVVPVLQKLPSDIHIAILGPRNKENDKRLVDDSKKGNVDGRIHFIEPVKPDFVPKLASSADIFICPAENICKSYDLGLPNKIFDALFGSLPMVVSSLKEISGFVKKYNLGEVCDETSVESIAGAIKKAAIKKDDYAYKDKNYISKLCIKYCWEIQAEKLVRSYLKLKKRIEV